MPKIYLQRNFDTLVPVDEHAEKVIRAMQHGQIMRVEYIFPRSYKNLKRFFKFLTVTLDMQDHFSDIEPYREWIIMKSGHFYIITAPNGYQIFKAKSIAFDEMEEEVFRKAFSNCIDAFLSVWGDRVSREDLEKIIDFS